MANKASLADVLFNQTQQQVLRLLLGQPERSFYVNEIVRFAGMGIGAVQRELARLSEVGLLVVTRQGNQKHYQANQDSPIFAELRSIVIKTFGVVDHLKELLAPYLEGVQVAFIYGSVAKREDTASSDIDLLLIGDGLSYSALMELLAQAEPEVGRVVNPVLYRSEEFVRKANEGNAFLQRLLNQPVIMLKGSLDDVRKSISYQSAQS